MNKRVRMLTLIIAITVIFCGCVITPPSDEDASLDKLNNYTVTLYFANNLYVETGNEELDQLIEVSNFTFKAKEGEQYLKLVDVYLRSVPEGVENGTSLIDDTIQFNSVTISNGTAIVDFASDKMSGGSLSEGYIISQIVESLIVSFDEINSVRFLINGQETESLMGHFDTTMPFSEGVYKNR